jgi:endonuclease YncB( thermonuclease family)
MKQARIWCILLLTWGALLFGACSWTKTSTSSGYVSSSQQTPPSVSFNGRVVSITDGDTITVLDTANRQYKIRLQGIDAPEEGQAFGNKSRERLSDDIFGKDVVIEWSKRDRYRRIVGKVRLNGTDVCLDQVKAGMAWHYKYYQGEQSLEDRKLYADAQDEAHRTARGLWADANPTPPWEFRHRR